MRVLLFVCLFVSVCLTSCKNPPAKSNKTDVYFDNVPFFEKECLRLSQTKTRVIKSVQTKGVSETNLISVLDWKKELGVFLGVTLKKSSFSGKYSIDTVSNLGINQIKYISLDERLPIKYLTIEDSLGFIKRIESQSIEKSTLINNSMYWCYVPDSGYAVKGNQKIWGGQESTFMISAKFVSK